MGSTGSIYSAKCDLVTAPLFIRETLNSAASQTPITSTAGFSGVVWAESQLKTVEKAGEKNPHKNRKDKRTAEKLKSISETMGEKRREKKLTTRKYRGKIETDAKETEKPFKHANSDSCRRSTNRAGIFMACGMGGGGGGAVARQSQKTGTVHLKQRCGCETKRAKKKKRVGGGAGGGGGGEEK